MTGFPISWTPSRVAVRFSVLLALVFALPAATGCGGKDSQAERDAERAAGSAEQKPAVDSVASTRKRTGDLKADGLEVQTHDLNRDERPDQWEYRNSQGLVVRTERDMNFDGDVDVWQYPDRGGEIVEEEMDLDMDGEVDLVAYYENGDIRRKDLSVDFEEQFSISKYYNKEGHLLRVERDKDGDETTDVWEYYDEDGNRERVGWDENGDGVPDSFDDLP